MTTPTAWAAFLKDHPNAHLLQTPGWAALKCAFGWQSDTVQLGDAGAQILFRRLAPGLRIAYVPRGPVGSDFESLLPEFDRIITREGVFALKLEPDLPWTEAGAERLHAAGFTPSAHPIQPARTIVVDLSLDEDDILARMKQKTRYNIRLAARKGVSVRPWDDVSGFAEMMVETAQRDGFAAHSREYYQTAYDLFHGHGACELFHAEIEGTSVAALMVFIHGARAWYFYGASRNLHREKMPTYLLQWEAMRWAKASGCLEYDLWGIPDADSQTLETAFPERADGLWGVYRFKRGFGGEVVRSLGTWDRIANPIRYRLYQLALRLISRMQA